MIWRQMLKFGLIGALATLVHIIIGVILIQSGRPPLIANAFAFATAFLVGIFLRQFVAEADAETAQRVVAAEILREPDGHRRLVFNVQRLRQGQHRMTMLMRAFSILG